MDDEEIPSGGDEGLETEEVGPDSKGETEGDSPVVGSAPDVTEEGGEQSLNSIAGGQVAEIERAAAGAPEPSHDASSFQPGPAPDQAETPDPRSPESDSTHFDADARQPHVRKSGVLLEPRHVEGGGGRDRREPQKADQEGRARLFLEDDIVTATRTASAALEQLRKPRDGGGGADGSAAVTRLLALVEEIHRAASSRSADGGVPGDVIARIERLESWVATNRLS